MIQAYKLSEYIKLDGRNLIVDIERGRTMLNFIPRKYGKGIGSTRKGKSESRSRSRSKSRERKKKSKKEKKDKKRKKSYSRSPSP